MIKAKSNILHNGSLYKTGDVFEMDDASEKKLIIAGSAEAYNGEPVTPKKVEVKVKVVAGATPDETWTKVKILGYARSIGVTADQTLTKKELLKLIESAPIAPPVAEGNVPAVTVNENAPVPTEE
jgi:hypothetical protein